MPDLMPDLMSVEWPQLDHVRAVCSLRSGGVSAPPYDSLNLGDHVGDEPAAVASNRLAYTQALGARPVYLKQVHGWDVAQLDAQTPDGTTADACATDHRGVACTIMVADCLPVLFAHRGGTWVGAAHAGWRGLCGVAGRGVLEAVVEAFYLHFEGIAGKKSARSATHSVADELQVWLGPCIGPQAFEVGAEVREAFLAGDERANEHFKSLPDSPGKFLANLPALARQRLQTLGVRHIYGNDGTQPWCTVSHPSRFFSHRRDRISGRLAASIWLV